MKLKLIGTLAGIKPGATYVGARFVSKLPTNLPAVLGTPTAWECWALVAKKHWDRVEAQYKAKPDQTWVLEGVATADPELGGLTLLVTQIVACAPRPSPATAAV